MRYFWAHGCYGLHGFARMFLFLAKYARASQGTQRVGGSMRDEV